MHQKPSEAFNDQMHFAETGMYSGVYCLLGKVSLSQFI